MKQRVQIVSESVHNINEAINTLREAVADLMDCNVPTLQLQTAIRHATAYASAVQASEEAAKATRLAEPVPPAARRDGQVICPKCDLITRDELVTCPRCGMSL